MNRIALLSSEPLRPAMAGIALRYYEMARRLPRTGIEVVLLTPGDPAEVPEIPAEVRRFERGKLAALLADCDGAVAQGQLANDLLLEVADLPTAIDLYDPWLVENLYYSEQLGLDPYRNDHATWVLQMSQGDFFLCSSPEQRLYYQGFLTALGRVNPERLMADPDLAGLIAAVPFGVPEELPDHRPVLPPRREGERRLLFGGLYDWYDPWTLLEALALLEERPWTLLLVRNPNPESTPQRLFGEVEKWCRKRGWWGERVRAMDWVPVERRYDLLRDVDGLVATHKPSLETSLSLRTRFLDALVAGCPSLTSEGGAISRLLIGHGAGWVVPEGDVQATAAALGELLAGGEPVAARRRAGRELARGFEWSRVLAPLVEFCRNPLVDASKERFAFRPPTVTPETSLAGRLRRKLRRSWRLFG